MNICKDYTGIWSTLLELLGGDKALTETEGGPQWGSMLGLHGVHLNIWEARAWTDSNWADMAVYLDALMCGHEDQALDLWPSMLRRVNAYTLPIVGRGFVEEWSGSSPGGSSLYNAHEFDVIEVRPGWGLMQKPVTVAQWLAFCDAVGRVPEPQRTKGQPLDWPVTCVNAEDCLAFAKWVSEVTGHKFDLPTEPEWRQAAAHPNGGEYPWGAAEPTAHLAVYGRDDGPRSVGSCPKGAGVYGHLDLAGNVWEWCWAEGRTNNGVEGPFGSAEEEVGVAAPEDVSLPNSGAGTPLGASVTKVSGSGGSDEGPLVSAEEGGLIGMSGDSGALPGSSAMNLTASAITTTGSGSGGSKDVSPFESSQAGGKTAPGPLSTLFGLSKEKSNSPTKTKDSDCEGEDSHPLACAGGVGSTLTCSSGGASSQREASDLKQGTEASGCEGEQRRPLDGAGGVDSTVSYDGLRLCLRR